MLIHLSLGDAFRESISISQMDVDVGNDLIFGWDWISSHDLHSLFQACQVGLWSRLRSCSWHSSPLRLTHAPRRRPSSR